MLTIRERVRARAKRRCEYCQLPDEFDVRPFQVEHIRAKKHSGRTTLANLAWACLPCNSFKGPNVAGYEPEGETLYRLFNPRDDSWVEHFEWNEANLVGLTPIGRTTIEVLRINQADRIELRRRLLKLGVSLV